LILSPTIIAAQDNDPVVAAFRRGNEAYNEGNFNLAIEEYTEMIRLLNVFLINFHAHSAVINELLSVAYDSRGISYFSL